MAYNMMLAERVRAYLFLSTGDRVEEKEMFSGLAFLVDGKMCINVSGSNLMCRYDPALRDELAEKPGFSDMVMKGKVYKGYALIEESFVRSDRELAYWIELGLAYNPRAKSSKKKK